MAELIVACVRTGTKYDFGAVIEIRDIVAKHLHRHCTVVCLTDQPERCTGVAFVDITAIGLKGAWGKLALFEPLWREHAKVIYLDLHPAVIGDITALADVPGEFAIGENSSVMVLGSGMSGFVWAAFDRQRAELLRRHKRPSTCIHELYPSPTRLELRSIRIFPHV